MAALSDCHAESLIELRRVTAEHLVPLLEEETSAWNSQLEWDFRPSADLVRRFVHIRALSGFVLMDGSELAGYSYYVCEESKGLIGDLYVRQNYRTAENERALLEAVLGALTQTPGIRRVEAQIMMLGSPADRLAPYKNWYRSYPRHYLRAALSDAVRLPSRELPNVTITPWGEERQQETARLIASAYEGHIDSQVNDQYCSPGGASRFLMNIVQYPGCGSFFAPASYAAADAKTGALSGISLASLIAADVGHITQVCVAPSHRGTGLGYELMRRSLLALAAHGCRSVSLTVTAANEPALRLYRQMGFEHRHNFTACVWQAH
jgi:ribosomal protein S18 acetylase RimI-like enzyme